MDACVIFIRPRISATNCCHLMRLFHKVKQTELAEIALICCLENFDIASQTRGFLELNENLFEKLLVDERLNLDEARIFENLIECTTRKEELQPSID